MIASARGRFIAALGVVGLLFGAVFAGPSALAAPAIFTVNSTGDTGDATPGDGLCDDGTAACTLRAAIQEANANAGSDSIGFNLGAPTIAPASPLPAITEAVAIDGTTNPSGDVTIDGSSAGATATGIRIGPSTPTVSGVALSGLHVTDFGGSGIRIDANDSFITADEVDNNLRGISVVDGVRNHVTQNSIHDNAELGIDLVGFPGEDPPSYNDLNDADTGPNQLQNHPILWSAVPNATSSTTQVRGAIDSKPSVPLTLEFFSTPQCDPYQVNQGGGEIMALLGRGEGGTYLGSTSVTPGAGVGAFNVSLPAVAPNGHSITATAIDPNGNTSEFSECIVATDARMTSMTSGPRGRTPLDDATFNFTSAPGATFECSLDGAAFSTCSSGITHNNLPNGVHHFEVRATVAAVTDPTPVQWIWRIGQVSNGSIAFTSYPRNSSPYEEIFKISPNGNNRTRLTNNNGNRVSDITPAWSPAGTRIAFTRIPFNADSELMTMDASGNFTGTVTSNTHIDISPTYSPDGDRIAFMRVQNGQSDIFVEDLSSGVTKRITKDPAFDMHPSWSPTGDKIAFEKQLDNGAYANIFTVDIDADMNVSNIIDFTPDATLLAVDPTWTPSGRTLYFTCFRYAWQDSEICSKDLTSGAVVEREISNTELDSSPAVSPEGDKLVWSKGPEDGDTELWVWDFSSNSKKLLTANQVVDFDSDWQPKY